jgi:hypothetical protein
MLAVVLEQPRQYSAGIAPVLEESLPGAFGRLGHGDTSG